jgi:hypothetical protein
VGELPPLGPVAADDTDRVPDVVGLLAAVGDQLASGRTRGIADHQVPADRADDDDESGGNCSGDDHGT